MAIHYLTYDKIDKAKWDHCISSSINGVIYAESTYLDHMAERWDGLVMDDYIAVMPVTWKMKWGIRYCYQPAFFQQGGVFSAEAISSTLVQQFLDVLSLHFKFGEITLNEQNRLPDSQSAYRTKLRNNFLLHLEKPYEIMAANYNAYIRQRIGRAAKNKLVYGTSEDIASALSTYENLYAQKMDGRNKKDFEKFADLCEAYKKQGRLIVRTVHDENKKTLLAVVVMLRDNRSIYNLASSLLPEGKKLLANYFLYDNIIREYSNKKLTLDFEGSDIPGVAFFYEKFAQENKRYLFVKWNRLPKLIRLIKR